MHYSIKDLPVTLVAYALGMYCVRLIYKPEYLWQEGPAIAFAMIILAIPFIQNYTVGLIQSYLKRSVLVLFLAANLGFIGGVIYDQMPVEKNCSIGERC